MLSALADGPLTEVERVLVAVLAAALVAELRRAQAKGSVPATAVTTANTPPEAA